MPSLDDFGGASGGGGGLTFGSISSAGISSAAGAVSDLFGGFGDLDKAKGAEEEAGMYRSAAQFAQENVGFTQASTAIKEAQQAREVEISQGRTEAAVAGSGFAQSGTGLDLLRESAQNGAQVRQVLGYQGLITEAGYQEQSAALTAQANAADAAAAADKRAGAGSFISSAIKGAAAIASLVAL